MKVSYEVRPSQSPWPRVMRLYGQLYSRSVHRDEYKSGCHWVTVLGHPVLCLASKMRSHCVSEDSDAVAHNPKI